MFHCDKCGNEVIRSYPDGKIKCRTNIIIWEKGRAICKCLKCKAEVEIPVTLHLPGRRTYGKKTV
jgi:hypothetical protein